MKSPWPGYLPKVGFSIDQSLQSTLSLSVLYCICVWYVVLHIGTTQSLKLISTMHGYECAKHHQNWSTLSRHYWKISWWALSLIECYIYWVTIESALDRVHEDMECMQRFYPIFQSGVLNIVPGHCTDLMRAQITGNDGQCL